MPRDLRRYSSSAASLSNSRIPTPCCSYFLQTVLYCCSSTWILSKVPALGDIVIRRVQQPTGRKCLSLTSNRYFCQLLAWSPNLTISHCSNVSTKRRPLSAYVFSSFETRTSHRRAISSESAYVGMRADRKWNIK